MSASESLRDIISRQKAVLAELEKELEAIARSDLAVENELLKKQAEQLQASAAEGNKRVKELTAKNAELKDALFEQLYSERLRIINSSQKKRDAYFKSAAQGELNRLAALEKELADRASHFSAELEKYNADVSGELREKLGELSERAAEAVAEAKERIARETGAFTRHSAREYERLMEERLTDDAISEIGRKNSLEAFIGGNLLNKLGVLFVILGIIAVSRYTFFKLPDTFRGIIMFAVSGVFLAAGEFLNRKRASVFSLGITAAGVAGLYASLSISYFYLNIISMYPALLLCVLITAGAFVLSQRYDSQTIAAFALIGGYIPIISASENIVLTYGAMVYFIALNLLALSVSFYKKWRISMFTGFFLNLLGTLYIVISMFGGREYGAPVGFHELSTILYVLFAFGVYTFIPILGNYREGRPFTKSDVVVLGLNTAFSALIMYVVLAAYNLSEYNGVTAIAFAVSYIGLARFIETRFAAEKRAAALFYLTGLTFVVLVIPFQFGREWLSLGWLVQGVCLAVYGILAGERGFKRAGFIIGGLCLAAFAYFDVFLSIDSLFSYKYFAVTLGSVLILGALAYKRSFGRGYDNAYKYAALINLWFYCLYLVSLSDGYLLELLESTAYNRHFLMSALAVTVTFVYAIILPRIPLIADKGTKILSACISVFGMLFLAVITGLEPVTRANVTAPLPAAVIAALLLIALSGLAMYAMYRVLMFFVLEARLPAEYLPFILSLYFLIVLTQNLIKQYNLSATSVIISIIYVAAALAWVIYGFTRRIAFMRRLGLALAVLAVAKLFLIDLSEITQGYKIVSYFSFGATLLGISFVYQYFSKRLITKKGGEVNAEEADIGGDSL